MRDVLNISTIEIMKKYANRTSSDFDEESTDRYSTLCHAHKDSTPSLKLYDKTDSGEGWDYHCFVCGAHGNNIQMMLDLGIVNTKEEAVYKLREDFGLQLPDKVEIEYFSSLKGLDINFCTKNSIKNVRNGIEFPYLDLKHEVAYSKVRVKYEGKDKYYFQNGISGTLSIMYGMHWLEGYDTNLPLYLVEGETDTLTLRQAGYQVLGVPSASAWCDDFSEVIEPFQQIIICKDNDEAGKKLIKDIKDTNPLGLYSINFFGSIKDINDFHTMKCKSDITTFKVKFEELEALPVTYETLTALVTANPKIIQNTLYLTNVADYIENPIELDFMVTELAKITKISKKTIRNIVEHSFKKEKTKSADEVISDDLIVRDNAYYKTVIVNNYPQMKQISNFIIRPFRVIDSDGEMTRVLKLINVFGATSKPVTFTAEELANPMKFCTKCISAGDYIFKGGIQELQSIIELIFSKRIPPIFSPRQIGRLDNGAWLFNSFGIDTEGTIVEADEEGIINFNGNGGVYLPASNIVSDTDGTSGEIPDLDYDIDYDVAQGKRDMVKFIRSLKASFGTLGVYNGVGWLIAGVISDAIFTHYKMFPYLFIVGKRNSGKTTLAGMLYEVFGFGQHRISSIESPTNVGMLRTLRYMSSLPVAYDDYRNTNKIKYKDNLLLDIYNRHGSVKGTLQSSTGVRQEVINGYVLISGEDIPSNNALRTRCVIMQVSANEGVRTRADLDKIYAQIPAVQKFIVHLMQKYQSPEELEGIMDTIGALSEELVTKINDQRYAINHSIFAGALLHELGDTLSAREVEEYTDWTHLTSAEDKASADDTHAEAMFFSDVIDLLEQSTIDTKLVRVSGAKLYLRLRPLHKQWSKYLKLTGTEDDSITESTLKSYLTKEPSYLKDERANMGGSYARVLTFNLTELAVTMPDVSQQISYLAREEF